MTHRNHDRQLVVDEDYLVLEEAVDVPVADPNGGQRNLPTSAVSKVYLASANEETFLCTKCKRYTGDSPSAVIAHAASHTDKLPRITKEQQLKLAAFDLLPQGMQANLLARATAAPAPEEEPTPVQKERARRNKPPTRYGCQPFYDIMAGQGRRGWDDLADATGLHVTTLQSIARGANGTGLTNAQRISSALNKPLVELFDKKMLTDIAKRK
jgi:helix-turn-helix protein